MKRAWVIAAAILIVAATPSRVKALLENAIANESNAAARYEAFAVKAAEEGNLGAASFFRAAARAEHVHAERFAAALRERGLGVPDLRGAPAIVGGTLENLRVAAIAEASERDSVYREAIAAAVDAKDDALAKTFDQARDTEIEHANLIASMLRDHTLLTSAKTYYVCNACGYTTDVALPMCALCRAKQAPQAVE